MKSPHEWICLEISVQPNEVDDYVTLLWDLGTTGLEEVVGNPGVTIRAFFPGVRSDQDLRREYQNAGGKAPARLYHVLSDPRDWVENYKKNFHGFSVGRSFYIHPSWEDGSPNYPVNLVIDPGHAFGTGTHESTQLCLMAIEELVRDVSSVADVGTGSGILALAARRLNSRALIVAIDNDWQAIEMAQENLARNQAEGIWLATATPGALNYRFGLVIANLAFGIFQQTAADLARLAMTDLVISGFTSEQAGLLADLFLAFGFRENGRWDLNGWTCLRLARINSGILRP